jgi:plastocyanin
MGTIAMVGLVAGITLVAVACGGSSDSDSEPTNAPATNSNPTATTAAQPTSAQSNPTATTAAAADPTETNTPDPMQGGSDLPTSIEVHAIDSKFDVETIEAPANTEFAAALVNDGVLPHNLSFFTKEGGDILAEGANGALILEGETAVTRFVTPGPGTYFFVCVVHPDLMKGDFIVR